jgi:hypothetical protein
MNTELLVTLFQEAMEHGLSQSEIIRQLELFRSGINPVVLSKACTSGDGIIRFEPSETATLIKKFELDSKDLTVLKFVPASGAASRMFKDLASLLNNFEIIDDNVLNLDKVECRFGKKFIENITSFAFWDALSETLSKAGYDANDLLKKGDYRLLIEYTLSEKGLNYANLPKALILFHAYDDSNRTSLEEHFHEGVLYAMDGSGKVHLHFTVSPEHEDAIRKHIRLLNDKFDKDKFSFNIELSFQASSTDTLAVDENNLPFKDDNGFFLFRPGGHGALLKNLNSIEADIIFIKNIDNVVPDYLKSETEKWKKALGGFLLNVRSEIFDMLSELDTNDYDLNSIKRVCIDRLMIVTENELPDAEQEVKELLRRRLNRPLRVCGMVKNEGEPGGGPFWVDHGNGKFSPQIVETSQIDLNSEEQAKIVQDATHFNPVDLICSVKNYKGDKFDLDDFSNPKTAFIAEKSSGGRKLKALERPGLWNGAMENWITFFVEVPIETFNPVKTINDLLRPQHQPKK